MVNKNFKAGLLWQMHQIETEKQQKGIAPVCVTFLELQQSLKLAINELCKEKKIDFGNTLNDVYFKINEQ